MSMQPTGTALADPGDEQDDVTEELVDENGIIITLPSGVDFPVLTSGEARYLEERRDLYTSQFHFGVLQADGNISDKQDLDRLLILELFCLRWGHWLSMGKDYFGDDINEGALRRSLAEYNGELRQLKKLLRIDKQSRDQARGEDSVPVFIENLLRRAKEFGVHREHQAAKLLELGQQLIALLTYHDNADAEERREMHVTEKDLLEWIRDIFRPEFEQIDQYFRIHHQRFWVRSL